MLRIILIAVALSLAAIATPASAQDLNETLKNQLAAGQNLSTANGLMVKAALILQSLDATTPDIVAFQSLARAHALLQKIIDEHPNSDLAVALVTGQAIGRISLEEVSARLAAKKREINKIRKRQDEDQIWLFRRDHLYSLTGLRVHNREILILTSDQTFYSGSVGHNFTVQSHLDSLCTKTLNPSLYPGDENLYSRNAYINFFLKGNFRRNNNDIILFSPDFLGTNSTPFDIVGDIHDIKDACKKDVFEMDPKKIWSLYSAADFDPNSKDRANNVWRFYRDGYFHVPHKIWESDTVRLKHDGDALDGGVVSVFPIQNFLTTAWDGLEFSHHKYSEFLKLFKTKFEQTQTRLEFKGPFSLKSAYQANYLLYLLEASQARWGCLVQAIDGHNKIPGSNRTPYMLSTLVESLGDFYDMNLGHSDLEILNRAATYMHLMQISLTEFIEDFEVTLAGHHGWIFNSEDILKEIRDDESLRRLLPYEYVHAIIDDSENTSVEKLGRDRFIEYSKTEAFKKMITGISAYHEGREGGLSETDMFKEIVATSPTGTCGLDELALEDHSVGDYAYFEQRLREFDLRPPYVNLDALELMLK